MGLMNKLQDYFGSGVSDSSRTVNNKKVIDALTIEDDMDGFIRKDALHKHATQPACACDVQAGESTE